MSYFTPSYDLPPRVHLLKNPSLTTPQPIPSPAASVHPLPPDLSAYFVYPFSLEAFVLQGGGDPGAGGAGGGFRSSQQIEEEGRRYARYLEEREESKKERERERIRRIAPGWNVGGEGALQPTKRGSGVLMPQNGQQHQQKEADGEQNKADQDPLDSMAQLGEYFDRLDASKESAKGPQGDQQPSSTS
ncbi:hypothetical protein BDZ90DRAFT_145397 [Jaminaea rosea]|uniref:Uncharacterized protein n=1 Tax=Jaminaea rosea TaxID=1569628 RepID=A0A316UWN5_9BASI|nr:hypothetical protein BDZ90DRAFT_145397 [Jaminaea rosea]PWN28333.1 hypothetical protein BDZ90DRAFT_145397 [Jaminaea rosea]